MDLRERAIRALEGIGFPGYGIGGLSVGESKAEMHRVLAALHTLLPQHKPRYLMGVGSPEDLLEAIGNGVDLFDCVLPTHWPATARSFVPTGRVNIRKAVYRTQEAPWIRRATVQPAGTTAPPTCTIFAAAGNCSTIALLPSTTCVSSFASWKTRAPRSVSSASRRLRILFSAVCPRC